MRMMPVTSPPPPAEGPRACAGARGRANFSGPGTVTRNRVSARRMAACKRAAACHATLSLSGCLDSNADVSGARGGLHLKLNAGRGGVSSDLALRSVPEAAKTDGQSCRWLGATEG